MIASTDVDDAIRAMHQQQQRMDSEGDNDISGEDRFHDNATTISTDNSMFTRAFQKRKKRRVLGWIVRTTVRCSTYRPSSQGMGEGKNDDPQSSKGLTYHDFHLALSIDVEVKRDEVQSVLLNHFS